MDKDIVPITGDEHWHEIVERLVDSLKPQDLPDKVLRATEYLLAGWPTYKVAKQLHVDNKTVRRWLSDYPTMAAVVAQGRKLLMTWRMAKLEQQFGLALERSDEILNMEFDGTYTDREGREKAANPKVLPVIAAQIRYMLGMMVGNHLDITVTHEVGDTVLKAREDALEYIANQLRAGEDEPVEVVYRVIDASRDTAGPLLNEQGDAPFGSTGTLDTNESGTLCHLCGKRYKGAGFRNHIVNAHSIQPADYELTYMLPEDSIKGLEER